MVALSDSQRRNLAEALSVAMSLDEAQRIAFGVWSESRAMNWANGGLNTSNSPGFDSHPEWRAILRRSLDYPHDGVGNNGRSVGVLQQTPVEVGGGWGDMAGCMVPATAAARFRDRLTITDDPNYSGYLLQSDGSKKFVTVTTPSPVVADVLRVQQPMVSEALSDNYGRIVLADAISAMTLVYRQPASSWWATLMHWSAA